MDIEVIHGQMLDGIDARYKKTAGYPAWDFTRAFAFCAALLDDNIAAAEARLDIDNLRGADLERWTVQRKGIYRKGGANATAVLSITGNGGEIVIEPGDAFSTASGLRFEAQEGKVFTGNGTVAVRAESAGTAFNVAANTITRMPVQLGGVVAVTNMAPASGGTDLESDDVLRERYYYAVANASNGANVGAYVDWAMSVDGVGWARCFAAQNPAGTAKPGECCVYVVGTDGRPAAADIVREVQKIICPDNDGSGRGLAPIGAKCTVYAPEAVTVNVSVTITGEKTGVEEAIRALFAADAYRDNTLSYAQMLKAVMSVDGVQDCTLTMNNKTESLTCTDTQVFVPGTVTVR
ncbi:MAG: baseplate J/gp47 family protein [Oscillospiraceae bacterium]|nr:baseplate J/gp47 family protein [Oscillospiraceae bacterium]